MKLGPNQTRWLEALESDTYKQGKRRLRNINDEYCCLGVGAELFKQQEPTADDICYAYCGHTSAAPQYAIEALALLGDFGEFVGNLPIGGRPHNNLANLNDNGMSFKEIAQHIRAEPHRFFTWSK